MLSACFALGAYTTLLYGLSRQKSPAIARVAAMEVPREAATDFVWY